jgi:hypothetical protein
MCSSRSKDLGRDAARVYLSMSRPFIGAAVLSVMAVFLLLARPASAAPVLDQVNWPATTEVWVDNDARFLQTFTMGIDGQLVGIDLLITTVPVLSPFSLHIETTGFSGTVAIFDSETVMPGVFEVDLSAANLHLAAGDLVSFTFWHDDILVMGATEGIYDEGGLTWGCVPADGCRNPAGPMYPDTPPDVEIDLDPIDIAFITHVEPRLPEPSAALLFAAGMVTIVGTLRKR